MPKKNYYYGKKKRTDGFEGVTECPHCHGLFCYLIEKKTKTGIVYRCPMPYCRYTTTDRIIEGKLVPYLTQAQLKG